MKTVLLGTKPHFNNVYVEDLKDGDIIGIEFQSSGDKLFVVNKDGNFFGIDNKGLDLDKCWQRKSLQEYIFNASKQGIFVCKFDDMRELYKWMSE